MELAAFERLKKIHTPLIIGNKTSLLFITCFDHIIFILVGKESIHKSLNEYEFQPYPTTDQGVRCH